MGIPTWGGLMMLIKKRLLDWVLAIDFQQKERRYRTYVKRCIWHAKTFEERLLEKRAKKLKVVSHLQGHRNPGKIKTFHTFYR